MKHPEENVEIGTANIHVYQDHAMTFPGQQETEVADNHAFPNPALSGSHRNDCGHLPNSPWLISREWCVLSMKNSVSWGSSYAYVVRSSPRGFQMTGWKNRR